MVGGRRGRAGKYPPQCTHSVEIMGQNTDRARIFGDAFVDLNVKASRRRNGAQRAGPPTPGVSDVEGARPGEEIAREDGQRRERSAD